MASTITLTGDWLMSLGNRRGVRGTGNLGNPYTTGGIAVSASQVGLGTIDYVIFNPAGGYVFEYLSASGKVKAYYSGAATNAVLSEVATNTDLSGVTFSFLAEGY